MQETVYRRWQFRIKPTEAQMILIWKTFGCCRKTWNELLDERIESNKELGGDRFKNTTPAHLKNEFEYLNEVDSSALCNTQLNLNQACKKQFAKGKTPEFRRKGKDVRSYTTNKNTKRNNIEIISKGPCENYLKLPKLGQVKIILHRSIPDDWVLKSVTVIEKASGKFIVSILFEITQEQVPVRTEYRDIEGFDYSMPHFAVSASGKFDVPAEKIKWYRRMEKKLAKEQRKLSHMEFGSKNYWAQRHKIGRICEKIANRRKDFLHKLSYAVARQFDAVVVEDINLCDMSQGLHFGKSVYDNGFGMFRVFLAYKLRERGGVLIKVSRWFPSSQRCSKCGYINPEVKNLEVRKWECPCCHAKHNRDKNAAANLVLEGFALLNRWSSGDSSLYLAPSGVLSEKKPQA